MRAGSFTRIATTEIYTHVSDEALRTTLERADVLATLAPVSHQHAGGTQLPITSSSLSGRLP